MMNWLRKDTFWSFMVRNSIERYSRHSIAQAGGQLAYFFVLAIFPFIMSVNALIGVLHIPEASIYEWLTPFLPTQIVDILASYSTYLQQLPNTSLRWFGLVLGLFSASAAVTSLIDAINKAYHIRKQRNFIQNFIISISLMLLLCIIIPLTIVLMTLGQEFMGWVNVKLGFEFIPVRLWNLLRLGIILASLVSVLALMYYVIPNKKLRIVSILPGTVFSVICWFALTYIFSIYVQHSTRISIVYGSIGAIIILMMWLYLIGIILVVGAELNAMIDDYREHKRKRTYQTALSNKQENEVTEPPAEHTEL